MNLDSLTSKLVPVQSCFPIALTVTADVPYSDVLLSSEIEATLERSPRSLPPVYRKGDTFRVLGIAVTADGPHEYLVQFDGDEHPDYIRELPPHE